MIEFAQLTISGVALGGQYALVALGFVVIMKASGVLSIFQGGLALTGGYVAYHAINAWGLPFVPSALLAIVFCALVNLVAERQILRRAQDGTALTAVFVTFGLMLAAQSLVEAAWGSDLHNLGDPWGLDRVSLGPLTVSERDLWTIALSAVVLVGVFLMFSRTKLGLAMRAAASDEEAATAQGISPGLTQGFSWALAGGLAALAGILLATAIGGGVRPGLGDVVFAALPAIYLGGVSSPAGAVVGALIIGLSQQWAAGYAPESFGQGFGSAFPYMVLVVLLLVRPQGLFGTKEVVRA